MNALTFLKFLRDELKCCPLNINNGHPEAPSNNVLRQWLNNKSIRVNGEPLEFNEEIDFPIFSLVFFPNSERRTTIW